MPTKVEKDSVTGRDTTGHQWDGLKELNTPLPRWWLYVFYACIAFAIVWAIIYPSIPMTGARGLSGWTARGAIGPDLEAERLSREPMLAKLRGATPAEIAADPALRAYALAGGRIAFANNCAGCHGSGGQGAAGGFPSLADDDWLYGGSFEAIHGTIAHGVRNGVDADARGIAMPRFLADGLLTAPQVNDVTEHLLGFTGRATDAAAAERGAAVFAENCGSCHGEKGEGNRDMGAPRLNDQVWLYGGDKASILRSVGYARAGVMPNWAGKLDPAIVNMLTVYVHALGGGE
jgi:cytochrome c oxidase cbb3-type subunit III